MTELDLADYQYDSPAAAHTNAYLLPAVLRELGGIPWDWFAPAPDRSVFDLGCGNGSTAAALALLGYRVSGVDPSVEGIRIANETHPGLRLEVGSCYQELAARFGRFPVVVSLEVVEHVFLPRKFAACVFELLEPGGTALISTPYHGYWKNLALAVSSCA